MDLLVCQQCAEKYLKAYLIQQGDVPDRAHNLEDLLNDCVKHDATLTARMPEAQELNRWSVDPRYHRLSPAALGESPGITCERLINKEHRGRFLSTCGGVR